MLLWDGLPSAATARLEFGEDESLSTLSTGLAMGALDMGMEELLRLATKAQNLDLTTFPSTLDDHDLHLLRVLLHNCWTWGAHSCASGPAVTPAMELTPSPLLPPVPMDVSEASLACLVQMLGGLMRIPLIQEAHLETVLLEPVTNLLRAAGPLSLAPGAATRPRFLTDDILQQLADVLSHVAGNNASPAADRALELWLQLCQCHGQLGPTLQFVEHLLTGPYPAPGWLPLSARDL